MNSIFEHAWLGGLFGDAELQSLWATDRQIGHMLAFETALAHALEHVGRAPPGEGSAAASLMAAFRADMDRLHRSTAQDGLPVKDLVAQLRDALPGNSAIHTGATSQDVLDTALSLTIRDVTANLLPRLRALVGALGDLEKRFGPRGIMGRTRMQAALPITVADRIAVWRQPLHQHIMRLDTLRPHTELLQLGGAVGTRAAFGKDADAIAERMAAELSLHVPPGVWHADRTGVADYATALSLLTGTLGKIGKDICLMAQQGIEEISLLGGGGSSAMPHKSNPVLAELLVTLAAFNATQVSGMHHALVHEQERSGATWMLEWMIFPPMTQATGRALSAALEVCAQVEWIGTEA